MEMVPQNTALVIFGVTGDLSLSKVIPALSNLEKRELLPSNLKLIGIGRRDLTQVEIDSIRKVCRDFIFIQGSFEETVTYEKLQNEIKDIKNKIFYLTTFPSLYNNIIQNLSRLKLDNGGWKRIMLEKPIGHDLSSAQKIDQTLSQIFSEDAIFRVDHYLGKETVQNILTFRFYNPIFEYLNKPELVNNIQVTAFEEIGIQNRGRYYDQAGAIRDVGQNHLLQMLALLLMNLPDKLNSNKIRESRLKLLQQIVPDTNSLELGQYLGYQEEKDVNPGSQTETYFAFQAHVNNSPLKNIPIYLRAGKKMHQRVAEIAIVFKSNHHIPNVLIYRIQPNEGVVVKVLTKKVGTKNEVEETYMQYCYRQYTSYLPDAYETLLLEAFQGDQAFFPSQDEIEAQWKIADSLIKNKGKVEIYEQGSQGPASKFPFLEPSVVFCQI